MVQSTTQLFLFVSSAENMIIPCLINAVVNESNISPVNLTFNVFSLPKIFTTSNLLQTVERFSTEDPLV